MKVCPCKRKHQLSTQPVSDELVLFDALSGRAIVLNRVSATIWNLCDGHNSLMDIAERATVELGAPVPEEIVRFALRELDSKKLLEKAPEPVPPATLVSRRQLVLKLGSSAAVLLPIVAMVGIPSKAGATGGGGGCVLGETSVQLADGSTLRADAVQCGMWLRSFDPDSGEVRDGRVGHVKEFLAPAIHTLVTERGDILRASPSHLLIEGLGDLNGMSLRSFAAGDSILVYDRDTDAILPSRIAAIQISHVPQPVYGIEMCSKEHTLVTASVVSHNKTQSVRRSNPDNLGNSDSPDN